VLSVLHARTVAVNVFASCFLSFVVFVSFSLLDFYSITVPCSGRRTQDNGQYQLEGRLCDPGHAQVVRYSAGGSLSLPPFPHLSVSCVIADRFPHRRTFTCNGAQLANLDMSLHFGVPYDPVEVEAVVDALSDPSSVVLVHGARQAGKTSFGHHVCNTLQKKGRVVLRVSLEDMIDDFIDANSALYAFYQHLYTKAVVADVPVASAPTLANSSSWAQLAFRGDAGPMQMIVMIDEFDALLSATVKQAVVDRFLHHLRAVLMGASWLGSLLLVGSNAALSVKTSVGSGSEWNVANKFPMPGLNVDHLRAVFKEFTEERGWPPIPDDILRAIIDITCGHKGWCMLAGKCLDEVLGDLLKHPCGTDVDMAGAWAKAAVLFRSQACGLDSCHRMVEEIEAITSVDAMQLFNTLVLGRQVIADGMELRRSGVETASWAEWSAEVVRKKGIGQFLLHRSVFNVMPGTLAGLVVMGAPHMVSAAEEAADRVVQRAQFRWIPASVDDAHATSMDSLLLAMVQASFSDAMQLFRNGARTTKHELWGGRGPLPAEMCYSTALYFVAKQWLGGHNVCLEVRLSLEARQRADLTLTHNGEVHLVEIVSHSRTGSMRRDGPDSSSALGHLDRLQRVYSKLHDGATLWLVNFDRVREDAHAKGVNCGAGRGTNSKVELFTTGTWRNSLTGEAHTCDVSAIRCMNVLLRDDWSAIDSVAVWSVPRGATHTVLFTAPIGDSSPSEDAGVGGGGGGGGSGGGSM
jgi:hypothetical protein